MNEVPSPAHIAFVGAGAIGLPMAVRLARAGYRVTAVDPTPERRRLALAKGLEVAASTPECAPADAVIAMVATADQLVDALTGPQGLLLHMQPGSVCIVMSTVGPTVVADLAAIAAGRSVEFVDAPVTGGVSRAETGDLTILASGDAAVVDSCRPLLQSMGVVDHCGDIAGAGQSYKLVNQLLCSVHLVAAAEALMFAEHLGLDSYRVLETVLTGAGASWMLGDRGPRILAPDGSESRTALDIFVKDSTLVRCAAQDSGFDAPLIATAGDILRAAAQLGLGRKDDSQVREVYRHQRVAVRTHISHQAGTDRCPVTTTQGETNVHSA